jgi:PqqD family protein of HPr-rel-A system
MWRIPQANEILLRRWDDEWVVYHVDSGSTYLLNALGGCVLQALRNGQVGIEDLSGQVASCLPADEPADRLQESIQESLRQFMRLHLVEACA